MNNDEERAKPEPFSFGMTLLDTNRAKRPSAILAMPEEFLVSIGYIVGAWSQFERNLDNLLRHFVAVTGDDPSILDKDFRKRSARLRRGFREQFEENQVIYSVVEDIVSGSRRLYEDRNSIVHGRIRIKVVTGEVQDNKIPGKLFLSCEGTVSGQSELRAYSIEQLESMRYDFAHLSGCAKALLTGEGLGHLSFTQKDEEVLKSFWGNSEV